MHKRRNLVHISTQTMHKRLAFLKFQFSKKDVSTVSMLPHFVFGIVLEVFVHKRRNLVQISTQTMHKCLAHLKIEIFNVGGYHFNAPPHFVFEIVL